MYNVYNKNTAIDMFINSTNSFDTRVVTSIVIATSIPPPLLLLYYTQIQILIFYSNYGAFLL